mgnify:CR=1 FL=1
MRKNLISLPVTVVSLALLGTVPAHADGHPTPGSHDQGGHGAAHGAPAPTGQRPAPRGGIAPDKARNKPVFLVARLAGANEVPASAGDADGSGTALVRVQGDRVTFALDWSGITAPTLGHIHRGPAGVNGDVAVPLFTSAMPATVTSAAGTVTVPDPTIADGLRANPG